MPGEEFQGEYGIQEPSVQGNGSGPVEVLQAAGLLESGVAQAQFQAAIGTPVDLVGEDDLQEGGIVQLVPACQGNAFWEGSAMGPSWSRLSKGVSSVTRVMTDLLYSVGIQLD